MIYISIAFLLLFLAYISLKSLKDKSFIAVPAFIVLIVFVAYKYYDLMNQPSFGELPEKFAFLSHAVIYVEEEKSIALWVVEKGDETPTTYIMPWTREKQESLEKAKQIQRLGIPIVGEKKTPKNKKDGKDLTKTHRLYIPKPTVPDSK